MKSEVSPSFSKINNNKGLLRHPSLTLHGVFPGIGAEHTLRLGGQGPAGEVLSQVKVFTVLLNVPPSEAISQNYV